MRQAVRVPDAAVLHEVALRHLARYACSAAAVTRLLDRYVLRWAMAADPTADERAAARAAARQVVGRLIASGAVDDASFAAGRARSLARAGRSRRAIAAHLAARGVAAELAEQVLPGGPEHELAAALSLARRRRIGPFRAGDAPDPAALRRELAVLARGGFAEGLARQALAVDRDAAEALLIRLHRQS